MNGLSFVLHRGSCEWNSVHYEDFQGKKSSGYNVPGNFPGGILLNRSNHSKRVQII